MQIRNRSSPNDLYVMKLVWVHLSDHYLSKEGYAAGEQQASEVLLKRVVVLL